jgi:putative ABC transport system permease protein
MRHAFRSLLKSPGFTAIALLTLALGIGMNTSMFSVLNALLLRTLPYPEPDRLVRVFRTDPHSQTLPHSPANFFDYAEQQKSFTAIAALSWSNFTLAEPGQPALRLLGLEVMGDFFKVLGVSPALGRVFDTDHNQPGRNDVVVLSDSFWRERLAADPNIVGRQLRLDDELVTVIGVMPAGFDDRLLWNEPVLWRPIAFTPEQRETRGRNWLHVIARLSPDVSLAQAQQAMSALAAGLARDHPLSNAHNDLRLVSLARSGQNDTSRLLSFFAMGLAACVLLIACANLANLQFARNAARRREQAVRAALGASRLRLLRESLTESLLLSLMGGALGLLVAAWTNEALGRSLSLAGQTGFAFPIDWRVLGFAMAIAAITGIAFGLLPAWIASRTEVNEALKDGSRGATSGANQRLRHLLIVSEFALALVLLAGAGFFLRGIERLLARDHGWQTSQLLTANVSLSPGKYADDAARISFYGRLQTRLAQLPGVERAALSSSVPFAEFSGGQRFVVEGQSPPAIGTEPTRLVNFVDPGFFDTLGIALIEGRSFVANDLQGPMRTIINEAMAHHFWPGESAVGKRIRHPADNEWQEIVGVVRDVSFPTRLDAARTRFQAYRLLARETRRDLVITLRAAASPEALTETLRRAVAEIDPEQAVQDIRAADRVIERGLANFTVIGRLLVGFAALGLLLAALGLYGVIAGAVVQRTPEIGIRMALGAQIRDVLRLVLGQGLRLALLGVALGLFGAFAVARLLGSMVPALPAPEPVVAALVTATLLAVALLAIWVPARRATKVDPLTALRAE